MRNVLLIMQIKSLRAQPLPRHLRSLSESLLRAEWAGCWAGGKWLINIRTKSGMVAARRLVECYLV